MPPITWRNVDAPNIGDPSRTLAMAQGSVNAAFDQMARPLQQFEATDRANWETQKVNNTNEMLNYLSGFRTVEDAQAAINSGAVQGMLTKMGAQVDQNKVRQVQNTLIPDLQNRFTQGVAYNNAKVAEAERPIVGALTALLPDPKNRSHIVEAADAYQQAGMLRPEVVAELRDKARSYGRNDDEWQLKLNADKRAEEQLRLHARQVALQGEQQRRQDEIMKMGEISQAITIKSQPLQTEIAAIDARLKSSTFTGVSATDPKGRQAITDTLRETGIFAGSLGAEANTLWDGVRKMDSGEKPVNRILGPKGDELLVNAIDPKTGKQAINPKDGSPVRMTIPLTAQMVQEAVLRAKGSNYTDPSVSNVLEQLARMREEPGLQSEYLQVQSLKQRRDDLMRQLTEIQTAGSTVAERRLVAKTPK